MGAKHHHSFTIIRDSREPDDPNLHWTFPGYETEVGTLMSGDYSIKGMADLIGLERKQLGDLVSCCTQNRKRFKAELLRLRSFRCKAVIVECDLAEILDGQYPSRATPNSVIASICSFQVRYDCPFVFAGDKVGGERYALELLKQFHRVCVEFVDRVQQAAPSLAASK